MRLFTPPFSTLTPKQHFESYSNEIIDMVIQDSDRSPRAGRYTIQPEGHFAFVPEFLPPNPKIEYDSELRLLLSQAENAISRLDGAIQILPNPDLFVHMFIRKEAILSSQIEGAQSSLQDLLQAEAGIYDANRPADVIEVSNNVNVLNEGIKRQTNSSISLALILELHRLLLTGVRGADLHPGEFRNDYVWIGPPGSTIEHSTFVPPPPDSIENCMRDLERFIHSDESSPVLIRAGLVHAQFETIHPFFDGNGRIGRLLITLMLCKFGVLQRPMLYLSHFLKAHRSEYYRSLQAIRDEGDWENWLKFFLVGVEKTARQSTETAGRIISLREEVRDRLLTNLGSTAANALWLHEELFNHPITDVSTAATLLDVNYMTANRLIDSMVKHDVLKEITGQGRNRKFAYSQYIDIVTAN